MDRLIPCCGFVDGLKGGFRICLGGSDQKIVQRAKPPAEAFPISSHMTDYDGFAGFIQTGGGFGQLLVQIPFEKAFHGISAQRGRLASEQGNQDIRRKVFVGQAGVFHKLGHAHEFRRGGFGKALLPEAEHFGPRHGCGFARVSSEPRKCFPTHAGDMGVAGGGSRFRGRGNGVDRPDCKANYGRDLSQ
jgi:GNAT superfamily N-acetyltransferase